MWSKAGKALYIGASSMFAWQFAKMLYTADLMGLTRFVTMQNHYNLIYREEEREMIPLCAEEGIGIIPWSPLARGFLAGTAARKITAKPSRAKTDEYAQTDVLRRFGFRSGRSRGGNRAAAGCSNAQVALAWVLQQPGMTAPIIGASKMQHLEDAVKATEITLSEDELKALDEVYRPHKVLGHS